MSYTFWWMNLAFGNCSIFVVPILIRVACLQSPKVIFALQHDSGIMKNSSGLDTSKLMPLVLLLYLLDCQSIGPSTPQHSSCKWKFNWNGLNIVGLTRFANSFHFLSGMLQSECVCIQLKKSNWAYIFLECIEHFCWKFSAAVLIFKRMLHIGIYNLHKLILIEICVNASCYFGYQNNQQETEELEKNNNEKQLKFNQWSEKIY